MSPDEIIAGLPHGARLLAQGGAGESRVLAEALGRLKRDDLHVTGVWLPGVNRATYGVEHGARVTTFFMTPELKRTGGNVEFLPLPYSEIGPYLRAQHFDACLAMLTPPDADGVCSFGPAVDFLAELWPAIPMRIAQLNPATPRTHGPGIPREALAHIMEHETPLPSAPPERADDTAQAIAAHVAAFIPDGATLQAGIGKLPGACLRAASARRGLRIHSGLIGDWVLDLLDAGALADAPIVAGMALGSERLYREAASSRFSFRPASYTHSPLAMSALERFVTLNGALEVDLLGQVYSEAGPGGLTSGPGGALDFARGAKLAGGLRIIALPASAAKGTLSRIVAPGAGKGPVSLTRLDVDVIVTEVGAADLRGLSHDARAERLVAIADPAHQPALAEAWRTYRSRVLLDDGAAGA